LRERKEIESRYVEEAKKEREEREKKEARKEKSGARCTSGR